MVPRVRGPRAAGCRVLAYQPDDATARTLVRVSKSTAARVIDDIGPFLALDLRQRFRKGTVLVVDGTLVPTRDHSVAERSKNYR